ncbi:A/G-specific adenine glycosylase [Scatolibacter rhodanostii]|uniref:A/G-specific adenine glycosylase n=1 Tax=Scatolibacter rhodanostii TaxID=2014781 RepID=UPI000C06CFA0|nr:A/G-specific adenine glycosylase [Scatolibacter rhodanostii]
MTDMVYEQRDNEKEERLVRNLMDWYYQNQRDLIWRKTREPYRIWISEIMAQQTRITAVLPYYERFMKTFPTLKSLAEASEDEVLKSWEGLGYYSRARNLLKTAQIIQVDHQGDFPQGSAVLKKLPGIGEYTAGAIASICFDEKVPAVDGNVQRVFARIYENRMDISIPQSKKLLTEFVREVMPERETGIFNQALMELGALICIPKIPNCESCPVQGLCEAYKKGTQAELPVKAPKKAAKQESKTILLITNGAGEVLLRQRTEKLLGGLWEFYMIEEDLTEEEVLVYLEKIGISLEKITYIGAATHIFTHKQWNMKGYECKVKDGKGIDGFSFYAKEQIENLALPTALQFFRNWLSEESQIGFSV